MEQVYAGGAAGSKAERNGPGGRERKARRCGRARVCNAPRISLKLDAFRMQPGFLYDRSHHVFENAHRGLTYQEIYGAADIPNRVAMPLHTWLRSWLCNSQLALRLAAQLKTGEQLDRNRAKWHSLGPLSLPDDSLQIGLRNGLYSWLYEPLVVQLAFKLASQLKLYISLRCAA